MSLRPGKLRALIDSVCKRLKIANPIRYIHITQSGRTQQQYAEKEQLYQDMRAADFISDVEEPKDEWKKFARSGHSITGKYTNKSGLTPGQRKEADKELSQIEKHTGSFKE